MGVRGFLTRLHNGRFVFTKYKPVWRPLGRSQRLTAYPGIGPNGEGDPWWHSPNDSLCEESLKVQQITPPTGRQSIAVVWSFVLQEK